MAREESSREDLLGEATALVERIEIVPRAPAAPAPMHPTAETPIVAGFRAEGGLSVFFGEDPVYQFNADGELRRAYCAGTLLKAVRGRLVALTRERAEHRTQLLRHELTDEEHAEFLAGLTVRLQELAASLATSHFDVRGQVPVDADVLGRLRSWLETYKSWPIAVRPNV
jgi:hypothetical protein